MTRNSPWHIERLDDICDIHIGRTPPRSVAKYWGAGYPWLSIGDMSQGKFISVTKEMITDVAVKERNCRLIETNTLLLSFKLSIGKVGFATIPLYTNEAIAALPIKRPDLVDQKYLYWALQEIDLERYVDKAAKGKTLNKAKLREVLIPLPPLDEQKCITAILDKADILRKRRRQSIARLDTLLHYVFLDMFGDPAFNSKRWKIVPLDEIASKVTDGEHQTPTRTTQGIKLLSARNIRDGYIDFSEVDYISQSEFERIKKRCNPEFGDILISCSGTIGRVTTVVIHEPFTLVRSAALVKPIADAILPKYLEYYLRTQYLKAVMVRTANASSQANLFIGQIKELPVMVPPRQLQNRFIARVERSESIRQKQGSSLQLLENLFVALQQRAFSGELCSENATAELAQHV